MSAKYDCTTNKDVSSEREIALALTYLLRNDDNNVQDTLVVAIGWNDNSQLHKNIRFVPFNFGKTLI